MQASLSACISGAGTEGPDCDRHRGSQFAAPPAHCVRVCVCVCVGGREDEGLERWEVGRR
jgi:hypothetical protein